MLIFIACFIGFCFFMECWAAHMEDMGRAPWV